MEDEPGTPEVWRELIQVQTADRQMVTWHLDCIFDESEGRFEEPWHLSLADSSGHKYEAIGYDMYESLKQIRRQTDRLGVRLCCNGARKNTRPSGFYGSQGALTVYREYRWRLGFATDLVGTFDYAPPRTIGTVEEQEAYLRKVDRYTNSALMFINPLTWVTLAIRIPFNLVFFARLRLRLAIADRRFRRTS